MFKQTVVTTMLALATLLPASAGAADVKTLLRQADAYRLTAEDMRVNTQVEVQKNGALERERSYVVYLRAGRQSLVLMQSPAEKGQKVLMLGDDYWLILPTSQRPMRITPTQKLVGDASTGDIATMTWADDYDGELVGEEPCDKGAEALTPKLLDASGKVGTCLHLAIKAQRKGVTYSRIELYLRKGSNQPARADLFVASDKMAKRAVFKLDKIDGKWMVSTMTLIDQIMTNKETAVHYRAREAKKAPDAWFNPMFLTRSEALE